MTPIEMREKLYSDDDVVALLEKALRMGLDLKAGSYLEGLQIGELERLVTMVQ